MPVMRSVDLYGVMFVSRQVAGVCAGIARTAASIWSRASGLKRWPGAIRAGSGFNALDD
jgi:hypothetical protein